MMSCIWDIAPKPSLLVRLFMCTCIIKAAANKRGVANLLELNYLVVSTLWKVLNFLHHKAVDVGTGDALDGHNLLGPEIFSLEDFPISPSAQPFKQLKVTVSAHISLLLARLLVRLQFWPSFRQSIGSCFLACIFFAAADPHLSLCMQVNSVCRGSKALKGKSGRFTLQQGSPYTVQGYLLETCWWAIWARHPWESYFGLFWFASYMG